MPQFDIEDVFVPGSPGLTISYTFPRALEGHSLQSVVALFTKAALGSAVLTCLNKNLNTVWTVRGSDNAVVPATSSNWILSWSLIGNGGDGTPLINEGGATLLLPWYIIKEGDVIVASDNSSLPAAGSFRSMLLRVL